MGNIHKSIKNNQLFTMKNLDCPLYPSDMKVKGKKADYTDFVEITAEQKNYCCNNITVTPHNRVTKVMSTMSKYGLTPEEMEEIQDTLVDKINGRSCGLCL